MESQHAGFGKPEAGYRPHFHLSELVAQNCIPRTAIPKLPRPPAHRPPSPSCLQAMGRAAGESEVQAAQWRGERQALTDELAKLRGELVSNIASPTDCRTALPFIPSHLLTPSYHPTIPALPFIPYHLLTPSHYTTVPAPPTRSIARACMRSN